MKLLLFLIVLLLLCIIYIETYTLPNVHEVDSFLEVTSDLPTDYSKINGIQSINWVNLDRSVGRKDQMEELLENVCVQNNRISAIDGKTEDLSTYIKGNKLTNSEIACTLSHIKTISSLKESPGDYFMICEDDISFGNLKYFSESLEDIIKEAPTFDILMIFNTNQSKIDLNLYNAWNKHIASTVAYIITKKGINKFINEVAKYSNGKFELYKPINVADIFIYKYLNTFVYKYNFISTQFDSSTIHRDHLYIHKKNHYYNLNMLMNKHNNDIILLKDGKTKLTCPFYNDYVCDFIRKHGTWEEDIQKDIFDKYVKKGDHVIDGGAFIGSHTVKLSQLVGESGRVYAFEADPTTFKVLKKNIQINNCKNVILFNKGIGDKFGFIKLINEKETKTNRGGHKWKYSDFSNTEIITIDSLSLPRVDFIKLDVEGMEDKVFLGMAKLIKKHKPIIVFEAWKDKVENTKKTLLGINNYNITHIYGDDYLAY